MEKKTELRKKLKGILSNISDSDFDNWSHSLSENLNKFLNSKLIIGGFAPISKEPVWYTELPGDFKFAFPSYEERMLFRISTFLELEKRSDFGVEILSPKKVATEVVPDILLIPGLAFSLKGERLGRGKGFYDRYLKDFSGTKVGLCFECQLEDLIPTETHDQKMNLIITEKNIYQMN
jgi:5-formyltetrahydrofolate cyclo-ligase